MSVTDRRSTVREVFTMLDSQMIDQLKAVFSKLENQVELVVDSSSHDRQSELVEMLTGLAQTSKYIQLVQSGRMSDRPHFFIRYKGQENGISFTGVPGGHEFSSLVLAILNSDHKGKLPDQGLIDRIQRLKGPIHLKTYISLSCENCPDVVQALNLMTVFHSNMTHQMVDGAVAQKEVQELNIQGVPSVVSGTQLLSAGKVGLLELIERLEDQFGTQSRGAVQPIDLGEYNVVVVGAGPAGASAAIYAARKGLKTLVIAEKMGGQVQDTKGIENFISVPYTEGPQLSAHLAEHMSKYDIEILEHRRVESVQVNEMKEIQLDSGEFLRTRSLIVATGAKWRELGVPGEKEYLGQGVAFCPHCDGPYYKGKDIAVVGGGNSGVEAAIDLAGIVKSVVLLEFSSELKADKVLVDKLLSLPNARVIVNARTSQVLGDGQKVVGLEYEDRETSELKTIDLEGVFVQIGLIPNSRFISEVVETNRFGEVVIDGKGRTNVKGIYAAGDVTTVPFKQIVIAMGEGAKAALTAFEDLQLA